jgi:linoleoyl-CoA desaturase
MNTVSNPAPFVKPKYAKRDVTGFYSVLRRRVDQYFIERNIAKRGGALVGFKTTLLLTMYTGFYILMLSSQQPGYMLFFGILFGLTNVLIVFSIAHDATHNALFDNDRLNHILSYTFDMVGASAYLWNITHNQMHHGYVNVADYDVDIHQQAPLIRVSPTVERKPYHRFQPWYASFLYLIYSLYLVFRKDYEDFGIVNKKGSLALANRKHSRRSYYYFFAGKIVYYTITILIPFLVLKVSIVKFLFGFILIHFIMSIFLAAVLIPVHLVDEATFAVEVNHSIEDSWVMHVFKNTIDYSSNNKIANWFFGGLNNHLVHHLFPNICHVHYIPLSRIIEKTAKEFGLHYKSVSMREAIASHYRLLRRMSK